MFFKNIRFSWDSIIRYIWEYVEVYFALVLIRKLCEFSNNDKNGLVFYEVIL